MRRACLLLALVAVCLQGCAHMHPYSNLPATTPLAQRIQAYRIHEVQAWGDSIIVGGEWLHTVYDLEDLQPYFKHSGDIKTAQIAATWETVDGWAEWVGLTGLGVLTGGALIENRKTLDESAPYFWSGLGLMLTAAVFRSVEQWHYFHRMAESFDNYLKQDLDLKDSDLSFIPPTQENSAKIAFLARF
jgi:hypothetical protein